MRRRVPCANLYRLRKVDVQDYMASLDRTTQALADLKNSNLRSNQNAISELNTLLKQGTKELETAFRDVLQEGARPLEPLHYITKDKRFPVLPEDQISRLRVMNNHLSASVAQISKEDTRETPSGRVYAEVRGNYLSLSLRNLAAASVTTARKASPDIIYRKGTCAIGTYAQGLEGIFIAEYENVTNIFSREDWALVYPETCQSSLNDFAKTLQDLNSQIKNNITTDCYLCYEIIDIVSRLAIQLESTTGQLKRQVADSVRPIRDTGKSSLSKLLDSTRDQVQSLSTLPMDGGTIPTTIEVMTRLQNLALYLEPLSSIMRSLGDGGWNSSSTNASSSSLPSLKSFDVGADGVQLFAHYASDTLDVLLSNLENKARTLLKGRSLHGIFIANNVSVIDRMIRQSELQPLLGGLQPKIESWRKKGTQMYLEAWREPSQHLLDSTYTNRGNRPHSGGGVDSAAFVKALSSKDKDATKEKFRSFNISFDELIRQHKSYKMEREVKASLARDVTAMIEPLYARFWDRYHEIDRGKGKYVKYDKGQLSSMLASLAQ
jgi:exocyst complex component 7